MIIVRSGYTGIQYCVRGYLELREIVIISSYDLANVSVCGVVKIRRNVIIVLPMAPILCVSGQRET